MSLIQEALRRQQEEANKAKQESTTPPSPPQATPVAQPEPPPTPQPQSEKIHSKEASSTGGLRLAPPPLQNIPVQKTPQTLPSTEEKNKTETAKHIFEESKNENPPEQLADTEKTSTQSKPVKTLVIGGILILVLIVIAVAGIIFLLKQWSGDENLKQSNVAAKQPSDSPASSPSQQQSPIKQEEKQLTSQNPATQQKGIDVVSTSVDQATPAVKKTITWPVIVLSGIAGNQKSGSAILNGEIVGLNETFQGVKLKEIRGKSVVLEYRGEIKILDVGSSTQ